MGFQASKERAVLYTGLSAIFPLSVDQPTTLGQLFNVWWQSDIECDSSYTRFDSVCRCECVLGWILHLVEPQFPSGFLDCPETIILDQSNREADDVTNTWKRPPTSQQVKHFWRTRPIELGGLYESASPLFQHIGQDQIGWLKQNGWDILEKCRRFILCEGWRIGCGRSSSLNSLITSKQASSMNDLDLGQRPK